VRSAPSVSVVPGVPNDVLDFGFVIQTHTPHRDDASDRPIWECAEVKFSRTTRPKEPTQVIRRHGCNT
jgi:hypothetical protein